MENETKNAVRKTVTVERVFGIILLLPVLFEWNNDIPDTSIGTSIYLGTMSLAGAYLLKNSGTKE